MPLAVAVHGGAWNIPDSMVAGSRQGVGLALEQAWLDLRNGMPALDVVERAVRYLEDDPLFDAGRGSHLNQERRVEMDASIMEGRELTAGAVAAIQEVRHPVSVARRVMERSKHVLLVGVGARRFAQEQGCELCPTEQLLVGRELDRFLRVRGGEVELVDREFDPEHPVDPTPMGTVGAVALDRHGHVAAATSTGGTQHKWPGRVGDTPVIGAGTYADDEIGAGSATGWGEGILRVVLTKTVLDLMSTGLSPLEAGPLGLRRLERVGGKGGLILLDRTGRAAAVFNTPRMVRGLATDDRAPRVAVERDE